MRSCRDQQEYLEETHRGFFGIRHRAEGMPSHTDNSGLTFQTLQRSQGLPLLVPQAPKNPTVGNAFHRLLGMRYAKYNSSDSDEGHRRVTLYFERTRGSAAGGRNDRDMHDAPLLIFACPLPRETWRSASAVGASTDKPQRLPVLPTVADPGRALSTSSDSTRGRSRRHRHR